MLDSRLPIPEERIIHVTAEEVIYEIKDTRLETAPSGCSDLVELAGIGDEWSFCHFATDEP